MGTLGHNMARAPVEAWEFFVALVVNAVFLGLLALLLWFLDGPALAARLAKGYALLWCVTAFTAVSVGMIQAMLGLDVNDNFDLYVAPGVAFGLLLTTCWSAFAALAVGGLAAGLTPWPALALHFAGFLAAFVGCWVISSFYQGYLYKTINLPLTLVSFIVFAAWPAAARALYGWFFALF
ncbi:MAG TPA: hypothetical protein VN228_11015 [Pyrinomonadaceae bacterium]|nr:hypothetical protein [Pyrinomonadaceae bacterium]